MTESARNFKVVLLGEGCVGKTSIVLRYIEDRFNSNHISTVQASFLNKKINLDGTRINLAIWDTAGQEKFHALGPIYYRSSHGAVLVYDITDEDSFAKVKCWVRELRKMLGPGVCLVIVGNKMDLDGSEHRHVSLADAEDYAAKVGAEHWQTSAKQNAGIEEMFLALAQRMLATARLADDTERPLDHLAMRGHRDRSADDVLVVDDEVASRNSSCCGGS